MWHHRWHPSDRTLTRYEDAELSSRRRATVDHHLATCARCAARLRAQSIASQAVRTLTIPDADRAECAALRARLRARLSAAAAQDGAGHVVDRPGQFLTQAAVLAIAGLIAAGAIVGQFSHAGSWPIPETVSSRARFDILPDASLTPGSVQRTTAADLCGSGPRPDRTIAPAVRQAVLRAYGMEHVPPGDYELDHLITPELGGASDRENLWPERYGSRTWNARVKDDLERLLARMVCEGRLELSVAQRDIAADWIAAYKKYFHASAPLTIYVSASDDDDPVVVASPRLVALAQLARR
jgi:Putative zinc-finger